MAEQWASRNMPAFDNNDEYFFSDFLDLAGNLDVPVFTSIGENGFGFPYDSSGESVDHDWYSQYAAADLASLAGPTPVLPESVIAGSVCYADSPPPPTTAGSPEGVEAVMISPLPGPVQRPTRRTLSKSLECNICGETLRDNHALQRHKESKHGDGKYICACGHQCVGRKDNYRRHFHDCQKPHTRSTWECICGVQSGNKADHQSHFESCRHGRWRGRGRPRKH